VIDACANDYRLTCPIPKIDLFRNGAMNLPAFEHLPAQLSLLACTPCIYITMGGQD